MPARSNMRKSCLEPPRRRTRRGGNGENTSSQFAAVLASRRARCNWGKQLFGGSPPMSYGEA